MATLLIPNKLIYAMQKLGDDVVTDLAKQLINGGKLATSKLLNSLKSEVFTTSNFSNLVLRVWALDYFKYVDKGRRPGAKPPPVAAIIPWVEAKGIVIGKNTTQQTAFIIARSIGIKGIQPLNMKENVINKVIKPRTSVLQQAYRDDVKEHYDQIIREVQANINK